MAKIFACCNWKLKFLGPILDYWRDQGHDVTWRLGYDPILHEQSDLCFVDVADRNAILASKNRFDARLVVRPIDIECWVGQPRGIEWGNVDAVIFSTPHIERLVRSYAEIPEDIIYHAPYGLDPAKWSFRERRRPGKDIACVAYRWSAKGFPLVLQVMEMLPGYRLHVLGKPSREQWLNAYIDEKIEDLALEVHFTDGVKTQADVDAWLEDKDYFLLGSQKEAFSYATAEAAAKGIKPVIHSFYGAHDIWPSSWLWDRINQAVLMILNGPIESQSYRSYIEDWHSLDRMMEGINRACGLNSL